MSIRDEVVLDVRIDDEGPGYRLTYRYDGEADRVAEVAAGPFAQLLALAATHYFLAPPGDARRRVALLLECGQRLYQLLDGPERLLAGFLRRAAGRAGVVVLSLTAPEPLSNLPWELLHDGADFLVRADLPVIPMRKVSSVVDRKPDPALRPLRLMFMACAPTAAGLAELDYDAEHDRILGLGRRYPVEPQVEDSGNLEELGFQLARMGSGFYDVVHLSGHAGLTPDGAFFATEGLDGERIDADGDRLAAVLAGGARAVLFLSGCRTAEGSDVYATVSLAEQLARRNVAPVVVGWGRPVSDRSATAAAEAFYRRLAEGRTVADALQGTYAAMIAEGDSYWHTLRVYVTGQLPGALIGSAREIGPDRRVRNIRPYEYDAHVEQTPFVGRRRELQQAIRLLRGLDPEPMGLVLFGMGGTGKTRLSRRIQERLSEQYEVVRVEGTLTAEKLLTAIGVAERGMVLDDRRTDGPLVDRLTDFLAVYPSRLLFDLDEFEYSFETEAGKKGAIRLVNGGPVTRPEAADTLGALVQAIQNCGRGPYRVLMTTRYVPALGCMRHFVARQLPTLGAADQDRMITRLVGGPVADGSTAAKVVADVREKAGGNARLLEKLLADSAAGLDADRPAIAARLQSERLDFLENDVYAPVLLDRVPAEEMAVLRAAAAFTIAVTPATLARLTTEDVDKVERRAALLARLGLLEWSRVRDCLRYRLPPVLVPEIVGAEDATATRDRAAAAARALAADQGDFLELDPRRLDEEALREVLSLANRGGDIDLQLDAAVALADRETFYFQFLRAKGTCENVQPLREDHRILRILADVHVELGHGQADRFFTRALDACPADLPGERAAILASRAFWTGEVLPGDALADLDEAIASARAADAGGTLAFALRTKARTLAERAAEGDAERVPALLEEAFAALEPVPDSDLARASVLLDRAIAVHLKRGDVVAALADLYAALQIESAAGTTAGQVVTLITMADAALDLGLVDEAERQVKQAAAYSLTLRMRTGVALRRGNIAEERGDLGEAWLQYTAAADMAKEQGHLRNRGSALAGLARIAHLQGDVAEARRLRALRKEAISALGDPAPLVQALIDSLPDELSRGAVEPAEAVERAREAATVANVACMAEQERQAWELVVDNGEECGADPLLLESALRRLLELYGLNERGPRTRAIARLGRLLLRTSRYAEAEPYLLEALAHDERYGFREASAELRDRLSEVARGLRRPAEAEKQLRLAARARLDIGRHAAAAGSIRALATLLRDTAPQEAATGLGHALALARLDRSSLVVGRLLGDLADLVERPGSGVAGDPAELRDQARAEVRRCQPLRIEIGSTVMGRIDSRGRRLLEAVGRLRTELEGTEGWTLPPVRVEVEGAPTALTIRVWGAPVVAEDLADTTFGGPMSTVVARLREVVLAHADALREPTPPAPAGPAPDPRAVVAAAVGWLRPAAE